jgi:septal ring factor EnvC (AmiA/AmiB activator)
MNAHTPTLETQIRETEEELAQVRSEIEPLERTEAALLKQLEALYREEAA